jgi:hypothetical protein
VPAEAVHGGLVRQAGARGRLVEGGHQGLLFQHIHVAAGAGDGLHFLSDLKYVEELAPLEVFQGQDVPTGKTAHSNLLV